MEAKKIYPHFARASKRLEQILSAKGVSAPANLNFKEVSASVLGFSSYKDLLLCRKQHKPPCKSLDARNDEELTTTELAARRAEQTRLLQSHFDKFQIKALARDIVEEWRPSSLRPQWKTLTTDIIEHFTTDEWELKLLLCLTEQMHNKKELELKAYFDEVRAIYKARTGGSKVLLAKKLESIAWALHERGGAGNLNFAIEILELLIEDNDYPSALFTLSEFLCKTAKTPQERNRYYCLLVKIKLLLNAGVDVFDGSKEILRYCFISGSILLKCNNRDFNMHGFSCLELGSKLGSAKCSVQLSYIHGQFDSTIDPDQLRYEKIDKNLRKWEYYSDRASAQGYDPERAFYPEVQNG